MRTENTGIPTRLLRVREFAENTAKKPAKKGAATKSRFVAPSYFDDEQRAAIREQLTRDGVGDDEGLQLFITAVEYEVGTFQLVAKSEKAPKPRRRPRPNPDATLVPIRRLAGELVVLLEKAPAAKRRSIAEKLTATDPFGRAHDQRYLQQLQLELGRLADACDQTTEPEAAPAPRITETARRFVRKLADTYRQCLDTAPTPDQEGTFVRVLCIVTAAAGVEVPCEQTLLEEILNGT